jgi:hypothetical protein
MTSLWTKFTAWLSGWPGGISEENKIKEKIIDDQVKESQARKTKKSKGLAPKKKKKARKQGNMK